MITVAQLAARQALIDSMAEVSILSPEQMADMVLDGLQERGYAITKHAAKLRAALEVTDEMADRALRAYHTWGGAPAWKPHDALDYQGCIAQMRTALMAALNEETK